MSGHEPNSSGPPAWQKVWRATEWWKTLWHCLVNSFSRLLALWLVSCPDAALSWRNDPAHQDKFLISFSGFSVGCCINRLSVTNLSSENNSTDVSTECSSHQGESERSVKCCFALAKLFSELKLVTDNLLSILVSYPYWTLFATVTVYYYCKCDGI